MSQSSGTYQLTEQALLQKMRGGHRYDAEDMFWVRWNMGALYLRRYYPALAPQLIRSRHFWQWFRHLWHMNDLWIYKHKADFRMSQYRLYQTQRFEHYKPTRPLLEAALRQTEQVTV